MPFRRFARADGAHTSSTEAASVNVERPVPSVVVPILDLGLDTGSNEASRNTWSDSATITPCRDDPTTYSLAAIRERTSRTGNCGEITWTRPAKSAQ